MDKKEYNRLAKQRERARKLAKGIDPSFDQKKQSFLKNTTEGKDVSLDLFNTYNITFNDIKEYFDKIEQDLHQAQIAIDMLEMLQVKMKGNLNADEEKVLSTVLQDLRLNYVDEVMKAQATAPQAANLTTEQ